LFIYFLSFFLFAVKDSVPGSHPLPGYLCAYVSLFSPFHDTSIFHGRQFEPFSLFLSGLANPLFLIVAAFGCYQRGKRRSISALTLLLMTVPFPWIVFHYESMQPREGYFLWIAGMALVLFSEHLSSDRRNDSAVLGRQ